MKNITQKRSIQSKGKSHKDFAIFFTKSPTSLQKSLQLVFNKVANYMHERPKSCMQEGESANGRREPSSGLSLNSHKVQPKFGPTHKNWAQSPNTLRKVHNSFLGLRRSYKEWKMGLRPKSLWKSKFRLKARTPSRSQYWIKSLNLIKEDPFRPIKLGRLAKAWRMGSRPKLLKK